jgi:hypothetical protein
MALSCAPAYEPERPPRPRPEPNASACSAACERLAELGCPEAETTPAGASCLEVCENVEASGTVTLDPACVAQLDACDLERCE